MSGDILDSFPKIRLCSYVLDAQPRLNPANLPLAPNRPPHHSSLHPRIRECPTFKSLKDETISDKTVVILPWCTLLTVELWLLLDSGGVDFKPPNHNP